MNQDKINSFSLSTILFSISLAVLFGIINSYLLYTSNPSTPISLFIGYIISIILSLIPLKLFNTHQDKNLTKKTKIAYGKLSIIINIVYILTSLTLYILITYRLTSFISSQYLIETNKIYILIPTLILTYYIANKGTETTTRISQVSFFICIIIFIFDALGLITHVNIDNLLPIISTSKTNILKSALMFSVFFSVPFTYINITNKNKLSDKQNFNKYYHIMHVISFIMITSAIIITLGVYGIHLTNLFDYPLYTVLKKISLFNFIDSIENASIMLWPLALIIAASIILLFINNILDNTTKHTNIIKKIIPIISFTISYLFLMNNTIIETFKYLIIPTTTVIIIQSTNLLTLLLLKIKKEN